MKLGYEATFPQDELLGLEFEKQVLAWGSDAGMEARLPTRFLL